VHNTGLGVYPVLGKLPSERNSNFANIFNSRYSRKKLKANGCRRKTVGYMEVLVCSLSTKGAGRVRTAERSWSVETSRSDVECYQLAKLNGKIDGKIRGKKGKNLPREDEIHVSGNPCRFRGTNCGSP
jgi:hypothetical protein